VYVCVSVPWCYSCGVCVCHDVAVVNVIVQLCLSGRHSGCATFGRGWWVCVRVRLHEEMSRSVKERLCPACCVFFVAHIGVLLLWFMSGVGVVSVHCMGVSSIRHT